MYKGAIQQLRHAKGSWSVRRDRLWQGGGGGYVWCVCMHWGIFGVWFYYKNYCWTSEVCSDINSTWWTWWEPAIW